MMVDPTKPLRNPTTPTTKAVPGAIINTQHPVASVAEMVAREHKAADDSLAHRLAMNVLGESGDPLKAAIEKAIPERVDVAGRVQVNPLTPVRRR